MFAAVPKLVASHNVHCIVRFDNDDGNARCAVTWVNIERRMRNCAVLSVGIKEPDCEILVTPNLDGAAGIKPVPGPGRSGWREWPVFAIKDWYGDLVMRR